MWFILNHEGCSTREVAENLGVSERTVRTEVAEINREELPYIVSEYKKGYRITSEGRIFLDALIDSDPVEMDDPELRGIRIVSLVLNRVDCEISDISEAMWLSESVLRKEIAKINQIIKKPLLRLRGEKCSFAASGIELRYRLFLYLKSEVLSDEFLLNRKLIAFFGEHWSKDLWNLVKRVVSDVVNIQKVSITRKQKLSFSACTYLCLVATEMEKKKGESFETPETLQPETSIAVELLRLELPQRTERDVTMLSKLFRTLRPDGVDCAVISEFTKDIYDEFCRAVFKTYSIDLRESPTISNSMQIHMEYMLRRIKEGLELSNPMTADIKSKYLYAYEISSLIVPLVEKYCNREITDDELSYLSLYVEFFLNNENQKIRVAIQAASRTIIHHIISRWVKTHFSNQVVIIPDVHDGGDKAELPELVIVSNVKIGYEEDIPSFVFYNLPSDGDIARFHQTLYEFKFTKRLRAIIGHILCEDRVKVYRKSIALEEVIEDLADIFESEGVLFDRELFLKDLYHREKHYPSILTPQIRIPHPLVEHSRVDAVALGILKKPAGTTRLVFLLAFSEERTEAKDALFEFFKHLSADTVYANRLIRANTPKEAIERLLEIPSIEINELS